MPEGDAFANNPGQAIEKSTIHADGRAAYDGLVPSGCDHYRVSRGENEFARGKSHADGIENFRGFVKGRLSKFHGQSEESFALHPEECERRRNHRHENLCKLIGKMYNEWQA